MMSLTRDGSLADYCPFNSSSIQWTTFPVRVAPATRARVRNR